jgi:hypothetical protein
VAATQTGVPGRHDAVRDGEPTDRAFAEFRASVEPLELSGKLRGVLMQYHPRFVKSQEAKDELARARGHFPNEQAALKCLYLTIRSLDPTGRGRSRWTNRWKPALNAFAVTFEGRITLNDN